MPFICPHSVPDMDTARFQALVSLSWACTGLTIPQGTPQWMSSFLLIGFWSTRLQSQPLIHSPLELLFL